MKLVRTRFVAEKLMPISEMASVICKNKIVCMFDFKHTEHTFIFKPCFLLNEIKWIEIKEEHCFNESAP